MRSLMVLLLLVLAACNRQPAGEEQAQPHAGIDYSHAGEAAPAIPFTRPDGGPASLSSFRGKPLLVNLWATWCAPCVAEMPALDRLSARLDGRVQVVVISQDMAGRRAVDPFFAKGGFTRLTPYIDKENVLMLALKADTLPMTVLYDAAGREQWRITGAFDWEGAKARALLDKGANPPR